MRDGLKDMIEHASIDLAYARAEIAMAEMGDEKARVERHLVAAAKMLNRLARAVAVEDAAKDVGSRGGRTRVA